MREESEPPFELEAVYDAEIAPLMTQIIAICTRVGMPMLATFVYAKGRHDDDPDGHEACTSCIPRGKWNTPEICEALGIIRNGASCRPKVMAFTVRHPHTMNRAPWELRRSFDNPPSE